MIKIKFNIYNRPVTFEGKVFPSVGIINVAHTLSFGHNEYVETPVFGSNEEEVMEKAEAELRDMLPERYKYLWFELEPICTECNSEFAPIPYEIFVRNPDYYHLTDCA